MKKTLDALDLLQARIINLRDVFEYEGSILNDEFINAYRALIFDLEDAENDKQISKQMADKYKELLDEFNYDTGNKIQELLTLNSNYQQDVEAADKKLENSLGIVGDVMQWQDDNDDKTALAEVQNLMGLFEQSYNDKGALNSVDALCKVGDAIKKGLEDKKISRKTAEELMKPLNEIKDNMFDEQLCDKKIREFKESLQSAMEKDGKEKGDQENTQPQSTNIITDAAVLARNIGKTAVNIAKGIKEANKKIDEKAEKAAAEYDKEQQREMRAADVVQSQADDKRKLDSDTQQQDKVADKQGVKKVMPETQKAKVGVKEEEITEEQALDNLYDLLNRYEQRYQENKDDGNRNKDLQKARVDAWDDFIKAYEKYKSKHIFTSPEMGIDFSRASFDTMNRERSIRTMRDILGRSMRSVANQEKTRMQPVMPEPQKPQDAKSKVGLLNVGVPLDKAKFKHKEKSELSPAEKGNRLKQGIVNVLNKSRDEKSQNRVKDDKEKQDAFVQMLRRKKLKGVVE